MKKVIFNSLPIILIVLLTIFSIVSAQSFNYTKIDFIDGVSEWNTPYIQLYAPAREIGNSSINRFPLVTSTGIFDGPLSH